VVVVENEEGEKEEKRIRRKKNTKIIKYLSSNTT